MTAPADEQRAEIERLTNEQGNEIARITRYLEDELAVLQYRQQFISELIQKWKTKQ